MRASWRQNLLLAAVVAVLGAALLYPIALIVGGAINKAEDRSWKFFACDVSQIADGNSLFVVHGPVLL